MPATDDASVAFVNASMDGLNRIARVAQIPAPAWHPMA